MLKQINININLLKHTLRSMYKTQINFCNVIFIEVKKNMYICKKLKPCRGGNCIMLWKRILKLAKVFRLLIFPA